MTTNPKVRLVVASSRAQAKRWIYEHWNSTSEKVRIVSVRDSDALQCVRGMRGAGLRPGETVFIYDDVNGRYREIEEEVRYQEAQAEAK